MTDPTIDERNATVALQLSPNVPDIPPSPIAEEHHDGEWWLYLLGEDIDSSLETFRQALYAQHKRRNLGGRYQTRSLDEKHREEYDLPADAEGFFVRFQAGVGQASTPALTAVS